MHNRKEAVYDDYLPDVLDDLRACVKLAKQAGIADEHIILDPGIGFGKTLEHNLILTNHVEILHELGYPILLGTSRKSMIGLTLDLPRRYAGDNGIGRDEGMYVCARPQCAGKPPRGRYDTGNFAVRRKREWMKSASNSWRYSRITASFRRKTGWDRNLSSARHCAPICAQQD